MDSAALVEKLIDDGQKLVEELSQRGFDVAAACWLRASDNGKWYFYIVSPSVDADGLAKAYGKLHPLVRAIPQPFWIDPLEIKLIGTANPISRDILAVNNRANVASASPIRWRGGFLGNVSVEEAYLYSVPATTP